MIFDEKDLRRAVESARRCFLDGLGMAGEHERRELDVLFGTDVATISPADFYARVLDRARRNVGEILE